MRKGWWICGTVLCCLCLKLLLPELGLTIGKWLSGSETNRVNRAIVCFQAAVSGGDSVLDAVEVFRDVFAEAD